MDHDHASSCASALAGSKPLSRFSANSARAVSSRSSMVSLIRSRATVMASILFQSVRGCFFMSFLFTFVCLSYRKTLYEMFNAFPNLFAISLPMGRLPFSIISTNPKDFNASTASFLFTEGPKKRSSTAALSVGCFFVSACITYLHQTHRSGESAYLFFGSFCHGDRPSHSFTGKCGC